MTDAELERLPPAIRRRYLADPARWGEAARSTLRQLDGEPPLPSPLRMAAELATSVAAHAADGFRKASSGAQDARWATCVACDHYRPSDQRCGQQDGCGCHLRTKIEWASSACPVGKWGPEPQ